MGQRDWSGTEWKGREVLAAFSGMLSCSSGKFTSNCHMHLAPPSVFLTSLRSEVSPGNQRSPHSRQSPGRADLGLGPCWPPGP